MTNASTKFPQCKEAEVAQPKMALVIQHVTTKYETKLDETKAFCPDSLIEGIKGWIERCHPEKVIVTYEDSEDEIYPALRQLATKAVPWKWKSFEGTQDAANYFGVPENDVVCTWARDEHYSPLYPWMKELIGSPVMIMGGYRNECVKALKEGLDILEIEHKTHADLTY